MATRPNAHRDASNLTHCHNHHNQQLRDIIRNIRNIGKWWNHNVLGDINKAIKDKEEELTILDNVNNGDSNTTSAQLEALYQHKDLMIWQKSRSAWAVERDRNTKYFHQIINRRRHKNNITCISSNNSW